MPSWWRRGWRVSRDAVRRARSNLSYYLIALFLAAVPVWQLASRTRRLLVLAAPHLP